jgi:hypothetical protein
MNVTLLKILSRSLWLFAVATCLAQSNRLEMPMVAERLSVQSIKIVNHIPDADFRRLPKSLAVFRYTGKPYKFSNETLQALLDQSAFKGTNMANLLRIYPDPEESILLATSRNLDSFTVNRLLGWIVSQNQSAEPDLRKEIPPSDAVPGFDEIRDKLFDYARKFGITTNDIERKPDRSFVLHRSDAQRSARGGVINYVHRRSVGISRGIDGVSILMNDDKLELTLGISGRPLKFELKWPTMEPVRTNRVLSASELMQEIKDGQLLGGVINEYPAGGIAEIELRELNIIYYDSKPRRSRGLSTDTDILPVASIDVRFKSKSGQKTEGVVYAPIIESR